MFAFLGKLIESCKDHPESGNRFFALSEAQVAQAEARLGRTLPAELVAFYEEIGCGTLRSPTCVPAQRPFYYFNRFLGPNEVVDLLLGEHPSLPDRHFEEHETPFFEVGEQLYLVLRPDGVEPNAVCWSEGEKVAATLVEFVRRLVIDPRYYHNENF